MLLLHFSSTTTSVFFQKIVPSPLGRTSLRTSVEQFPTMTAMREARGDSASADPINGVRKGTVNDRKFAFLNEITRPDYRSLPNSAATSQSSVPSTPITIPLRNTEQSMFREFGAPIATPEDELLDDMEIKSEPLLSPRRMFTDFNDERRCHSEEKENREEREDTEADTTIREDIGEDEEEAELMMTVSEVSEHQEDVEEMEEKDREEEKEKENIQEQKVQKEEVKLQEIIEHVESAPELSNPFREEFLRSASESIFQEEKSPNTSRKSPEEEKEAEEIRKMTESFGEPRKAVLERVYDTVGETDDDETETETETENEDMDDEVDDDVQRQIAAVSHPDDSMVFGWNGKAKDKVEKPTSLPIRYDVEAECSTPRRAEFCIEPEDGDTSEDNAPSSSADEGVLQQSLLQLQKQLRKTDVRCSRLEKICEFQQRDIDSLRFEVDWKDKRIEYLQKTLQEMEASQSDATSRSTSTS